MGVDGGKYLDDISAIWIEISLSDRFTKSHPLAPESMANGPW
jgi:hypothetical protein